MASSAVNPSTAQPAIETAPPPAKPWQILCGLAVSGFLLALPGGLLPLWGFHLRPDFGTAGNFFVALGLGVMGGGLLARRLDRTAPIEKLLTAAYFTAALALLLLSVAAPPARGWYQGLALFVSGVAAGLMNRAVFEGAPSCSDVNPATSILRGGIFFSVGSVAAAFLLAHSFRDSDTVRVLAVAAVVPAMAGILTARFLSGRISIADAREAQDLSLTQSMKDLQSPLAVLFALLLFFQFANEWSLAGWLPVFLIDRMGMSPETAVSLLAVYWASLLAGRIAAARLLRAMRHGRMLALSAFCALFGCTALLAAGSRFGVVVGLLLTGAGFSAIYPLVAERIRSRFSCYHPGFFNGIFTFALTGGVLAPFLLGHLAGGTGLRLIPIAVMLGSCAVFALVLLIWLGHKVSGQ